MLFYTHNPSKFAFSRDKSDFEHYISNLDIDSNSENQRPFGIIGVPFDGTTTYLPGARFGPSAVREASYNFENYNLSFNESLDAIFFDLGDLEVIHGNAKKTCEKLQETVLELYSAGIIPIIIGGEHSISLGVISALKEHHGLEDITVVHFDAHMDIINEYLGEKLSHATVMRRVFDLEPKKIIQIGVRSASLEEKNFVDENSQKIDYYTSHDIKNDENLIKSILDEIKGPIYISIDIDVLDPSQAPSVGNPTPCGLNSFQIEKFIKILAQKDVIGIDLVEVASREIGDITSVNGAKIIHDFLCLQ
ncbi:MAG: agmatinase [Methanobacteriales archaeon HGW-Methanobacteriales-1]|jgi:agmatinase|nr:MAG: agmatinase [Methanobacteriales archaeon HGW-Methanobacteriales-1]